MIRHGPHAARLGLRGEAQRLARPMVKIRRGHPAEQFLEQHVAIAALGVMPQMCSAIGGQVDGRYIHINGMRIRYIYPRDRWTFFHSCTVTSMNTFLETSKQVPDIAARARKRMTLSWSRSPKKGAEMQRIGSVADVNSQAFRRNDCHNRQLAAELKERQRAARFHRPERDFERLRRQNKLFVRERLAALLDPETPFLELSTLAANKAYDGEVPSAAQVVGIGIVAGREVIVHAPRVAQKSLNRT